MITVVDYTICTVHRTEYSLDELDTCIRLLTELCVTSSMNFIAACDLFLSSLTST